MEHRDFRIGTLFKTATGLWRCTDVGTRTIAAIHLEKVEVNGTSGRRTLTHDEAEAQGWFRGPPYIVGEEVFDEYDLEGCEPDNLLDFPGYEDRPPKRDWSQAVRGPFHEAVAVLRERRGAQLRAGEEREAVAALFCTEEEDDAAIRAMLDDDPEGEKGEPYEQVKAEQDRELEAWKANALRNLRNK